jgi:hypothetical protein
LIMPFQGEIKPLAVRVDVDYHTVNHRKSGYPSSNDQAA